MIRFLIVGISLLALPSCGADGTPMRPTASGTVTVPRVGSTRVALWV